MLYSRSITKQPKRQKNNGSPEKTRRLTSVSREARLLLLKWKLPKFRNKLVLFLFFSFLISMLALQSVQFLVMEYAAAALNAHPLQIQVTHEYTIRNLEEISTQKREVPQPWMSNEKIKHKREEFEEGDCKAMHDWQIRSYPNCNSIHENDFTTNKYVMQGGFRDIFRASEYNGEPYVMKTLRYHGHTFRFRDAERHRRDANAYSMLQGSQHVMNIYGYCKYCYELMQS